MLKFKRVTPFFIKASIVYHTLLYVLVVTSCALNYATYYGIMDFQDVGKINIELAEAKVKEAEAKAEAKALNERMMAAIENPPQPVELKPMKKGK